MGRSARVALFVPALVLVLALAACGRPVASLSGGPSGSLSGGPPASPVVGVLVSVDSHGLADVRGFDLRLEDGRVLNFTLGVFENPTEFPPGHLAEHLASSSPIRVFFRSEAGGLVVYRIEDAG